MNFTFLTRRCSGFVKATFTKAALTAMVAFAFCVASLDPALLIWIKPRRRGAAKNPVASRQAPLSVRLPPRPPCLTPLLTPRSRLL